VDLFSKNIVQENKLANRKDVFNFDIKKKKKEKKKIFYGLAQTGVYEKPNFNSSKCYLYKKKDEMIDNLTEPTKNKLNYESVQKRDLLNTKKNRNTIFLAKLRNNKKDMKRNRRMFSFMLKHLDKAQIEDKLSRNLTIKLFSKAKDLRKKQESYIKVSHKKKRSENSYQNYSEFNKEKFYSIFYLQKI